MCLDSFAHTHTLLPSSAHSENPSSPLPPLDPPIAQHAQVPAADRPRPRRAPAGGGSGQQAAMDLATSTTGIWSSGTPPTAVGAVGAAGATARENHRLGR